MNRSHKVQYFDTEGRENLSSVIKCIKTFLRSLSTQGLEVPRKVVFLTVQGEGPMLAYNQLKADDLQIIAVTFPTGTAGMTEDGKLYRPEISSRVRDFFNGVRIPIVTNRMPFGEISGADSHNREMKLVADVLGLLGSSTSLAVQAVLQATDAGFVEMGEQVIAATGDMAILATASTTKNFLRQDHLGFSINEIICKPRQFSISRRVPPAPKNLTLEGDITPSLPIPEIKL